MPSAQGISSKYANGVLTTKIDYCLNKLHWKITLDNLNANKVDGMVVDQSMPDKPFFCYDSMESYVNSYAVITLKISQTSYDSVLNLLKTKKKDDALLAISAFINTPPDDLLEGYSLLMDARKRELIDIAEASAEEDNSRSFSLT